MITWKFVEMLVLLVKRLDPKVGNFKIYFIPLISRCTDQQSPGCDIEGNPIPDI